MSAKPGTPPTRSPAAPAQAEARSGYEAAPPSPGARLAEPLINEAVIGLQDKDKFNRTKPAKDVANFGAYFLNPVVVRDT